jgi:hypothetical protein
VESTNGKWVSSNSENMAYMRHDYIGNHPLLCLALSLILLSHAIYGTITGTVVSRGSRVDRVKNPVSYWLMLAFECGVFAWLFSLFVLGIS